MQLMHVLGAIRRGVVVKEASEQLSELVKAVDHTQKPGKLTIEITVKPMKGGGAEKGVEAKVTSKPPVRDLPPAVFFSDSEGTLLRTDPGEQDMFIQIDPETGEIVQPKGEKASG